jgi:hypothetical protein
LALCAIDRTSGRCLCPRISPDYLRRLTEGAQKGAARQNEGRKHHRERCSAADHEPQQG